MYLCLAEVLVCKNWSDWSKTTVRSKSVFPSRSEKWIPSLCPTVFFVLYRSLSLSLSLYLCPPLRLKEEFSQYQKLWNLLDYREKVKKSETKSLSLCSNSNTVLNWTREIIALLKFGHFDAFWPGPSMFFVR